MNDDNSRNVVEKTLDYVEDAGDAARQAGDQVRQAGATAMSDAREIGQDASRTAKSVLGTLKDQARTATESQKTRVADGLAGVAEAVHRSVESPGSQQDWLSHLIERGADEVSEFASGLRGSNVQDLMAEVQRFARRQPALFLGASMAIGFGLTRMGRVAVAAPDLPRATTSPAPSPVAITASQPGSLAEQLQPGDRSVGSVRADVRDVVDTQGAEFGASPVAEANHALP